MRDTNHHSSLEPIEGRADQRSPLASFKDDESGSLVIFAVFMVLMILTIGGIGVDLMRSERDRNVLQHTLDRAILSAADLDQTQTPQAVVDYYFETAGLESFLSNVTVDQGINYKMFGAEAQSITTTAFMKMAGVDTLNATAAGVAEERIANVEISMVLDISGSMEDDAIAQCCDILCEHSSQPGKRRPRFCVLGPLLPARKCGPNDLQRAEYKSPSQLFPLCRDGRFCL